MNFKKLTNKAAKVFNTAADKASGVGKAVKKTLQKPKKAKKITARVKATSGSGLIDLFMPAVPAKKDTPPTP